MKTPRAGLALTVIVGFLAQSTGAADLAIVAARPTLAAQLPPRVLLAPTPAAAPATRPAPARPASRTESWLADARTVADWLLGAGDARRLAEARTPADVAREAVPEALTAARAPDAQAAPPADRILIAKDPEIVGAAQALSQALGAPGAAVRIVTTPRVEEKWFTGRGFRFRLVYLDAYGVTVGRDGGFRVGFGGDDVRFVPADVPPALRRVAPVFFHGMTARFQVEIVALEDLKDVAVSTRQEELDGSPLTPEKTWGTLTLAKGRRAVLDGSAVLLGRGQDAPVNFERTHLMARVAGEPGLRADQADAGLVDPPGPGL